MTDRKEQIKRKLLLMLARLDIPDEIPLIRPTENSGDGCDYSSLPQEFQDKLRSRTLTEQEYLEARFGVLFDGNNARDYIGEPFWNENLLEKFLSGCYRRDHTFPCKGSYDREKHMYTLWAGNHYTMRWGKTRLDILKETLDEHAIKTFGDFRRVFYKGQLPRHNPNGKNPYDGEITKNRRGVNKGMLFYFNLFLEDVGFFSQEK
jgi:hypothetical protein